MIWQLTPPMIAIGGVLPHGKKSQLCVKWRLVSRLDVRMGSPHDRALKLKILRTSGFQLV
jgi:hypothetical protein